MTNKTLRDYINLVENAQREDVAEDRSYQSKSEWMDKIRRLNPKVQFVDDDRGVTAVQGPGEKIAGEWNDDFGSGVIYAANIQSKLRLVKGAAEDQLEETSPDAIEKIEQLVRK